MYTKYKGILSTIGNTPLLKLERIFKDSGINVYAKMEFFNPGGSIKDRSALNIIIRAFEDGRIDKGTVVIESSSGNLGIGLAQVCSFFGLRYICVVDAKTTKHTVDILRAYKTEVIVITEPDNRTGEYLPARINCVKELIKSTPNSFWTNQYSNLDNPGAHLRTMEEISMALSGEVDYLFCATSTCGTIRGCSEYIKSNGMKTKIIAVDAKGSVIFSGERGTRLIPGHGTSIVPDIFVQGIEDEFVHVSDYDCVRGCRHLLETEAILAGGSSGGIIAALQKKMGEIHKGANCVAILADRGDRYLDTIYSDTWVNHNFGTGIDIKA